MLRGLRPVCLRPLANVYDIFFSAYIDVFTVCMCVLYKDVYSIIIDFKHHDFGFLPSPVLRCLKRRIRLIGTSAIIDKF